MPTFLLKYWPHMAVALGILVIFLYWNGRNNDIEDLRTQVADMRAEIILKDAQYVENARKFKKEIADQNSRIQQANVEYEASERRAAVLVAEANATNNARVTELEKLLELLKNAPTPQTCEASITFLVDVGIANPWPSK